MDVSYGSSPRVWGIHADTSLHLIDNTVHPHVCGEYANLDILQLRQPRFIPTCVGNTAYVQPQQFA